MQGIAHRAALGDFEDDGVEIDAKLVAAFGETVWQIRFVEVPCRDVDRHIEGQPGVTPCRRLLDGGTEDPISQRFDQATILRHRDELLGHQPAASRMLPPHQCLYPADEASPAIDLRLVFEKQLMAVDRAGKLVQRRPGQCQEAAEQRAEPMELKRLLQFFDAEIGEQLNAVAPRHLQVKDHQARAPRDQMFPNDSRIVGCPHFKAGRFRYFCPGAPDRCIIIDDQHPICRSLVGHFNGGDFLWFPLTMANRVHQ